EVRADRNGGCSQPAKGGVQRAVGVEARHAQAPLLVAERRVDDRNRLALRRHDDLLAIVAIELRTEGGGRDAVVGEDWVKLCRVSQQAASFQLLERRREASGGKPGGSQCNTILEVALAAVHGVLQACGKQKII